MVFEKTDAFLFYFLLFLLINKSILGGQLNMNIKESKPAVNLTLSAMFMAIGIVLPFFTGQIPQIGNLLLPMHIPVFLCGFICGWKYGFGVGFALPLIRSILTGRPNLFPTATAMAFELAAYGLVVGILYWRSHRQNIITIYCSMILAMLAGRVVWGIAQIVLLGVGGNSFTWQMFMAGAFFNAVPGIILQLILIPAIMAALNRAGLFNRKQTAENGEG